MKLSRRHLIAQTALASGLMLTARPGWSQSPTINGKRVIFLNADGGWDPPWFCDPKESSSPILIDYTANDVKTVPGTNIEYVNRSKPVEDFFLNHGKDLVMIKGLNMQNNVHKSSLKLIASGSHGSYPSIAALHAAARNPFSLVSFLNDHHYGYSDGLVPPMLVKNEGQLKSLVTGDGLFGEKLFEDGTLEIIEQMHQRRMQRLFAKERDANKWLEARSLSNFRKAQDLGDNFQKVRDRIPDFDFASAEPYLVSFANFLRTAAIGLGMGVVESAFLKGGMFDTHGTLYEQSIAIDSYLTGVSYFWRCLEALGVEDQYILALTSDFGRTPGLENPQFEVSGKGHHSVGMIMFLGKNIGGGKSYGGTTDHLEALPMNPNTLEVDTNNGKIFTFRDVHHIFRHITGITNHSIVQPYPLDGGQYWSFLKNI